MTHFKKKALLFIAPLLLAACVGEVEDHRAGVDGGNLQGNGQGGSANTGGGGPGGPITGTAVAMTRAQSDLLWDQYWQNQNGGSSVAVTSGGGGLDPNDLFIEISSQNDASCGLPFIELACGGEWAVSLVLPAAAQQVGIYDLNGPLLMPYSHMSETGPANGPGPDDCAFGGGTIGEGTLEVISIDAASVHIKLQTTGGIWNGDPSGEYVVPRCP